MSAPGEHAPQRWQKLGTKQHAHTRIFDVQSVQYQHPKRGTKKDFFVIDAPSWIMVLALTPAHELVLVRQFRYGIDDFSLEVPGGVVERGEDPLVAGVRELREETGYAGEPARLLGTVHPNPAMQNNRMHILFVENARRVSDQSWDEDEEMELMVRPVDEVYALARSGGITHALVLDALLLFSPIWQKLQGGSAV